MAFLSFFTGFLFCLVGALSRESITIRLMYFWICFVYKEREIGTVLLTCLWRDTRGEGS